MFQINDNTMRISLTKGDTASVGIKINDLNGSPYEVQSGDTLKLTVKRSITRPALVEITANDTHHFIFNPSDTEDLDAGVYQYDVQLTTAEGNIYTLVNARFVLLDEITT